MVAQFIVVHNAHIFSRTEMFKSTETTVCLNQLKQL